MACTSMHHDCGGEDELGPIDPKDKKYAFWERQIHALLRLTIAKNLLTLHEFRKANEGLLPEAQEGLTYYEKWAATAVNVLAERKIITYDEIENELGVLQHDPEVRFKKGDIVRVRSEDLSTKWRRPHLRTPGYIFGAIGEVIEHTGTFHNPEKVAFLQEGPKQPLYIVRFPQKQLWHLYEGNPEDTVDADIYQFWLEPSTREAMQSHTQYGNPQEHSHVHAHGHSHEHTHSHEHGHAHDHSHEHAHSHSHEHEHSHGHSHSHGTIDHGDHTHEARNLVEQKAVEAEGDDSEKKKLSEALIRLLVKKGLITPDELRKSIEVVDSWGQKAEGPRIVAKAWTDPVFKENLLKEASGVLSDLDIPSSNWGKDNPNATRLIVVANSPTVHHLVVCTLCSCYPVTLLGLSPPWYKSRSYRSKAVKDPRGTLKDFGLELPSNVAIQVHDSTADIRYLVIPERPTGTEGWTEEQLQSLVNRDSMIGVSLATDPATIKM
eukprot:Phypoly_transcript_06837.p1 GENE.Phypoly_transcript_06837~~Phypoly_transcript_06837.p1  ORF type:complete len:491 (+),score=51.40 Phypoly_transcript_06837:144-1616(+)